MNSNISEKTYQDIAVGDHAEFSVLVTPELIDAFADVSGDFNPLHTDDGYASVAPFGGRVAHGMLVGAFFSRLIGMHLPGKYALYLSQSLHFHGLVKVGTTLVVSGEVIHKTDAHRTIVIRTTALDIASKKILVSGEAMVQLLQ